MKQECTILETTIFQFQSIFVDERNLLYVINI